uniref:hypothetical protein n=1 Tax=Acetatifactor sp. TaxID=1872090 RepID=UPI00405710FD
MSYLSPISNISISSPSYPSSMKGIGRDGQDANPSGIKVTGDKSPGEECQTCKERKYMDGSNEMVSFKSPTHISPEQSASAVRSHEQEHVTNAYSKAANNNGKVIRASVTLHTAICPECGRSYISGGVTDTQIKYYNEENPYQQDLKAIDGIKYKGMNADYVL